MARYYLRDGYGDHPIGDGRGNPVGSLEEAIASLGCWEFVIPSVGAKVSEPKAVQDHIAFGREWEIIFQLPIPRRNKYGGSLFTYEPRCVYCEEGAVVRVAKPRIEGANELPEEGEFVGSSALLVCDICHKVINLVAKSFGIPSGDSNECQCK